MKITIIGAGKVGSTLAEHLSREGHKVTVVDNDADALRSVGERLDVMTVEGSGVSYDTLKEAGVTTADLLIAVTDTDELNLLTCLTGRKIGKCHTIARVRTPEYNALLPHLRDDLGLTMSVNPEQDCATEMAWVLRFPAALQLDTLARGRVELLKLRVEHGSPLDGLRLTEIIRFRARVLVCGVERRKEVVIPGGSFILQAGDLISIVGAPTETAAFLQAVGIVTNPVRTAILSGGGRIAYYLARQLLGMGVSVKIIERDLARCEALSEQLPKAQIIHGDATDQRLLLEEGIARTDAFAALTGMDEENILTSLYVRSVSRAKILTKINRTGFSNVISTLDIGSVFYPRYIAAERILQYVRGRQASRSSSIETLLKLFDNRAEALEFAVTGKSTVTGIPLNTLRLRKNLLIAAINRSGRIVTPSGQDTIEPGDTVIVVTTEPGLSQLTDIRG